MTLSWILHQDQQRQLKLFEADFAQSTGPPHRETIQKTVQLLPGNSLLLSVRPRLNHDCDGVYIHDIRVWRSVPQIPP